MKKIAFVGSSVLTAKTIEELRSIDRENEITLFSCEGILPYAPHRLPHLIKNAAAKEEILCQGADFYAANNVRVVLDQKIVKVHPKRKRLVAENKEQFAYDVLFLEDQGPYRFAEIKGVHKEGVFHLRTYEDTKKMAEGLGLVDVVSVEANDLLSLIFACALSESGKDVIWVCPDDHLLKRLLDRDTADFIEESLKAKGIRFVFGNAITEVLGNGDVKAIRLRSGKVFESQAVVFPYAVRDLSLLPLEGLEVRKKEAFWGVEDILIPQVPQDAQAPDLFESSFSVCSAQAKVLAAAIMGRDEALQWPTRNLDFSLFDASFVLMGSTKRGADTVEYTKASHAKGQYKKVLTRDHVAIGSVLVNLPPSEKARFESLIQEAKDLRSLSGHVIDEQDATSSMPSGSPNII